MRIFAVAGALVGWFALVLQLYLVLVQSPPGPGHAGSGDHLLQLFHHPDQSAGSAGFYCHGLSPAGRMGAILPSPSVQAGTAVYIAIVGIIYQLLLRQLWNPQGAQWVADVLLHAVIPAGYVLYWLIFAPRARTSLEGCPGVAGLSRRLPGLRAGAGSGERALSLPFCRCECAGIWRRAGPCGGIDSSSFRNGLAGRGCGPLDARIRRPAQTPKDSIWRELRAWRAWYAWP